MHEESPPSHCEMGAEVQFCNSETQGFRLTEDTENLSEEFLNLLDDSLEPVE